MRSFHYLAMLVALGNFISVVQSAPLPLQIGTIYGHNDHSNDVPRPLTAEEQQHEHNIRMATNQAHEQIVNMQNLLNQPHDIAHPHLVNAFGPGYNKDRIKATVDHLAAGTIHIGNVNALNLPGPTEKRTAETTGWERGPDNTRISLFNQFHQMNPESRAGTIIHEATHALESTKDWFSANPNSNEPNKFMPIHPAAEAQKRADGHTLKLGYHQNQGQLTQDFKDLRDNAGKVMHMNADSYKLLAHTATHGLGTLPPAPFPPNDPHWQPSHPQGHAQPSTPHPHPQQPCPPGKKGPQCTVL